MAGLLKKKGLDLAHGSLAKVDDVHEMVGRESPGPVAMIADSVPVPPNSKCWTDTNRAHGREMKRERVEDAC